MRPERFLLLPLIASIIGAFCGCASFDKHATYGYEQLPSFDMKVPEDIGVMILIPDGCFEMGAPAGIVGETIDTIHEQRWTHAQPPHEVCIPSFEIGKYEVTATEYCAFLADLPPGAPPIEYVYAAPRKWHTTIEIRDGQYVPRAGFEFAPATYVPYKGARRYCEWLSSKSRKSYRLPTEMEWEYAARGTKSRTYPWGETTPLRKCFLRIHYMEIAPWGRHPAVTNVGNFPEGATPDGVQDMIGNAEEWCGNSYYEYVSGRVAPTKAELRQLATPEIPAWERVEPDDYRMAVSRGPQYDGMHTIGTSWMRNERGHIALVQDEPYRILNTGFRVLRELSE